MTRYHDHYSSPVGNLILSATPEGLCAISFSDEEEPTPQVEAPAHELAPVRAWLDRYFKRELVDANDLQMPLDLQGTPFQLAVWKQLMLIPHGHTVSYGEIAKRLQQPGAARAVGLANNRNPIPIVIPCHRVVGVDGKLVGYAGGLWRKKALLRLEEGDLFSD